MKTLIKMPSIEQFRSVIHNITERAQYIGKDANGLAQYNPAAEMPVIKFHGTVKLHGTNGGVCYNTESGLWAQSKGGIISAEKDNAGFAFYVESNKDVFINIIEDIAEETDTDLSANTIAVYGEWCGGNIQKGIALSQLEKMFVIFGVKVSPFDECIDSYWIDFENIIPQDPEKRIYTTYIFQDFEIEIDFANPQMSQNVLIELTEKVEALCPVGKQFGVEGIGEGIVWTANWLDGNYRFKVKGEKHSSSKVKKLAEVDVEKLNSINEFVDYAVTQNRLNQGVEQVFTVEGITPDRKMTGDFVKWISSDVFKEETDTLIKNGLEPKDVGGRVSKAASKWFMGYLDRMAGLTKDKL